MTGYAAADAGGAVEYAGFWTRLGALIIDAILLGVAGGVLGFIIGLFVGTSGADPDVGTTFAALVGIAVGIAYYVGMESSARQATVGKLALGIKVTDMQGNRITPGKAAVRYFSKILSGIILLIGYIMAAFTARKQALHDIIAGTLVVKK
ncbi:MAG: RDD family protein [Actinomycetota bacterium]